MHSNWEEKSINLFIKGTQHKMEIVVDANIIISSLIATKGKTFDCLFCEQLQLFAPEFLMEEIKKHKKEITEKSSLSSSELDMIFCFLTSQITFIPNCIILTQREKAEEISPDKNDNEYFALALFLQCPIWSNDKQLKEQKSVIIYSTQELLKLINV